MAPASISSEKLSAPSTSIRRYWDHRRARAIARTTARWNDGFALAYQVVGKGRDDLVYLPGYTSNVDLQWDVPPYARFLDRLATFSRLILMDRRGVGCSDRLPPGQAATLEDIEVWLDEEEAKLYGEKE